MSESIKKFARKHKRKRALKIMRKPARQLVAAEYPGYNPIVELVEMDQALKAVQSMDRESLLQDGIPPEIAEAASIKGVFKERIDVQKTLLPYLYPRLSASQVETKTERSLHITMGGKMPQRIPPSSDSIDDDEGDFPVLTIEHDPQ